MTIEANKKDDVFFIEASFSVHPEDHKAVVYATCTQEKTDYTASTHVEWHQNWQTGISREVSLTSLTHRTVLKEEFSRLADALKEHIRGVTDVSDPVFVKIFDEADLERLLGMAYPDSMPMSEAEIDGTVN